MKPTKPGAERAWFVSSAVRSRFTRVGERWVQAVWCGALILSMMTTLSGQAGVWEKLPALPAPNGGFVAGESEGSVVVLGGTNWENGQKNWLATAYRFDARNSVWQTLPSMKAPLAYGIGIQVDGRLVVVGGTTGTIPFSGIINVANGKLAIDETGGLKTPAVLAVGGALSGEIIVVGGTDDAANVKGLSRSTFGFDPRTGNVRTLREIPTAVGVGASAAARGELFLFAGAKWNPETDGVLNLEEAWAYSVASNTWRTLKPFPFAVRGLTAVALDDNYIYLAGGYGPDGFTDRAFLYDVVRNTYTSAPTLPYAAQVGLVKSGDYVYCIGGEDRMKHRSDAFHRIAVSKLKGSSR